MCYNAYNDELFMVLYVIDQMQGIKLTRLKHKWPSKSATALAINENVRAFD